MQRTSTKHSMVPLYNIPHLRPADAKLSTRQQLTTALGEGSSGLDCKRMLHNEPVRGFGP